jgi:hypothetical protein
MKHYYLLFSFLLILSTGTAQSIVSYAYDLAGNRISRKVVDMNSNPSHVKKSANPIPVEDQLGERKITVYPNPTKGALAVEITGGDTNDELRIILFNADGRQLQNKAAQQGSTPINMSGYPAAYYILRVEKGKKSTEFKIIKQ